MSASKDSAMRPSHALILLPDVLDDTNAESARVWSLSSLERLERALQRAGIEHVVQVPAGAEIEAPAGARCALFRSDYFYDERLIAGLLESEDVVMMSDADEAAAATCSPENLPAVAAALRAGSSSVAANLRRAAASELAPAYNAALRKFDPPFLYKASASNSRETENRIFASSYKGITDLVTKWVFPIPARALVRQLAKRGIRPNSVTALSYLLTVAAAWLFYVGAFGTGLLCGWLMTFLDTVDGKLARVTLTSSPIGNVLDHGLDLIHPPIWWAAWAYGLAPEAAGYELAMWIIVVGYVTGRLLEGIFLLIFKMEMFSWRPFDAGFRTIVARRNPNLLMLTAAVLAGRPDLGFIAVAVWTVACHIVPIIRIAQALGVRARGGVVRPWHEEQAEAVAGASSSLLCVLMLLAIALAGPALADGTPQTPPDPAARLPKGEDASEYWDLTAELDSGHRVFARFLITNVGPGDRNAIAVGHVVAADGSVHTFKNGRRQSRWKLSEDRLHLDVGSSELDLHGPNYRLDIHKDDIQIDLRFLPAGSPQPPPGLLPSGYSMEILDVAAEAAGSLRLPGMSQPLEVRGRVGFVHTWLEESEAKLAIRRTEFFSLRENPAYFLELTTPNGGSRHWIWAKNNTNVSVITADFELRPMGNLPNVNEKYWTPQTFALEGPQASGQVRLDRKILSRDSLAEIPQPFRFFVARQMRPWRVWAESTFDVTLRADRDRSPPQLTGSGIAVVTFSSPTEKP